MKKMLLVPLLVALACLFAGCYGIVHNQISYTVSPEYFTKFKFEQFQIAPVFPERVAASIVGWEASWWMGLVIGVFVIPFGMRIPGIRPALAGTVKAFGCVAATALALGLGALVVAAWTFDPTNAGQFVRYDNAIADNVAFARAGTMHNFSYLGGLLGIVSGIIVAVRERRRRVNRFNSM